MRQFDAEIVVPELIYDIVLFYFVAYHDNWDPLNVGKGHILNDNHIGGQDDGPSSSFCIKTVYNGRHRWRFKIRQYPYYIYLGVWKTKNNCPPPKDNHFATLGNGYWVTVHCAFPHNDGDGRPILFCTKNDIIDMCLDFDTLTLNYSKNIVYQFQCRIENTGYKAAVFTQWHGGGPDIAEIIDLCDYSHC